MDVRQRTEEIERLTLASWATFSDASRGRVRPEEQDPIRPVFQRDRDRIIHCKAFRRLKQKTQVFLSPEGDLYRTTATARALEAAEVVTVRSVVELEVTVDYSLYERAALLIQAAGAKLADPQFTDRVTLRWQMPEGTEPPLLEQLRELTRGGAQVSVSQPFYAPF